MNFKTVAHKLVARICNYYKQNHLLEPGQVRTTKLIYLIEHNYYGWERKHLTDLDWIFWHYGPWSPTLTRVLKEDFKIPHEQEPSPGKFIPVQWTPPDFDAPELKFSNVTAEGIVLGVLDRFAALPYNELLDYVYFETAPMKDAVKGQPLDFSGIPKPELFVDPVSLLPSKLFNELRQKFLRLDISKPSESMVHVVNEELLKSIDSLDEEGSFALPEGEVFIDDNIKKELKVYFRD